MLCLVGLCWVGLGWIAMCCVGLDYIYVVLDWIGLW